MTRQPLHTEAGRSRARAKRLVLPANRVPRVAGRRLARFSVAR